MSARNLNSLSSSHLRGGLEHQTAAYAIRNKENINPNSKCSVDGSAPACAARRNRSSAAGGSRRRPGHLFFLTLTVINIYEGIREDIKRSFDDVISYCVSLERSKKEGTYHAHAFLEFGGKYLIGDIRQFVQACFPDLRFDLQPVKSRRNVLKYITKEDCEPFTNIKVSDLHFNVRVYEWAKYSETFSFTDPFVVEHRFCYRFLQQYHAEMRLNFMRSSSGLVIREYSYCNWTMPVSIWWNETITKFVKKRKCLYLYGASNHGKSTFIESLIGRENLKYVFYPGVGKFFMQSFVPNYHKVIIFEEFDYQFCVVSMLKRLCEGRNYAYPVKCGVDRNIIFKGPIIFISNYSEISDQALRNRLLFIEAYNQYWQDAYEPLPKPEVARDGGEAEEVISVSSGSSDNEEVTASAAVS